MARLSLCTLFPQTSHPLPATAAGVPLGLLFAVQIAVLQAEFLRKGQVILVLLGVLRVHNVRPYIKMNSKMPTENLNNSALKIGDTIIIHYSLFIFHYSFSEAHMIPLSTFQIHFVTFHSKKHNIL